MNRYSWVELVAIGASWRWEGRDMKFSGPPEVLTIVNAEIRERLNHVQAHGVGGLGAPNECGTCGESLGQWDHGTCPLCSAALEQRRMRTDNIATPNLVVPPVQKDSNRNLPSTKTRFSNGVGQQTALFGVEPELKKRRRK